MTHSTLRQLLRVPTSLLQSQNVLKHCVAVTAVITITIITATITTITTTTTITITTTTITTTTNIMIDGIRKNACGTDALILGHTRAIGLFASSSCVCRISSSTARSHRDVASPQMILSAYDYTLLDAIPISCSVLQMLSLARW